MSDTLVNLTIEELEEQQGILEGNLLRTMATLAPKFGITDTSKGFFMPDYILVSPENPSAKYGPLFFSFNPALISNVEILGHEVSHCFHGQLCPCEVEYAKTSFGKTLREVVAHYGGFVNCVENGLLIPGEKWDRGPGFSHDLPHKMGYHIAQKAIRSYGDSLLPELARMGLDEARITLSRLSRKLPISFYERRVLPLLDRITGTYK